MLPQLKPSYSCPSCHSMVVINFNRACQPCFCGQRLWLQDGELIEVKENDAFIVREGEKDPDFQFDISGWRGVIKKIVYYEPGLSSGDWALITWASGSDIAQVVPAVFSEACERNGWRTDGVKIPISSIRIVKPRFVS